MAILKCFRQELGKSDDVMGGMGIRVHEDDDVQKGKKEEDKMTTMKNGHTLYK